MNTTNDAPLARLTSQSWPIIYIVNGVTWPVKVETDAFGTMYFRSRADSCHTKNPHDAAEALLKQAEFRLQEAADLQRWAAAIEVAGTIVDNPPPVIEGAK